MKIALIDILLVFWVVVFNIASARISDTGYAVSLRNTPFAVSIHAARVRPPYPDRSQAIFQLILS